MKYVWIFILVVILVRIDIVLRLLDRFLIKLESKKIQEVSLGEVSPNNKIISFSHDLALKTSARKSFLLMLENIPASTDSSIQKKAIDWAKSHPGLFDESLDKDLESRIYGLRNQMIQKDKEIYVFIHELMGLLNGENLEMVKRFFSLAADYDLEEFLNLNSKSKDSNCSIIKYFGDPLIDDEKYNELIERLAKLETLQYKTHLSERVQEFAQRCHMVLKEEIKLNRQQRIKTFTFDESQSPDSSSTTPDPLGITP